MKYKTMEISATAGPGIPFIPKQVLVEDAGPGIADPDLALADGYSEGRFLDGTQATLRGLGAGLGAVQRLMDELTIVDGPGGGAQIVARKWLPGQSP